MTPDSETLRAREARSGVRADPLSDVLDSGRDGEGDTAPAEWPAQLPVRIAAKETVIEVEPGKFISPLDANPGYVRYPHPFLGRHYKAWTRAFEKRLESGDDVENSEYMRAWRGALAILAEWAVRGVPQADVDPSGDAVPLDVQSWVRKVALRYIADQLNLKNWRAPSGTT